MKTHKITFTLALLLGSSLFSTVYADSYQSHKEHRYEQQQDKGRSGHIDKRQNNDKRKNNNKKQNSGQPRQDRADNKVLNNRKDKHYTTHRSEAYNNRKYDRYPKRIETRREIRKERRVNPRHYFGDGRRDNRRYESRHGKRLLLLTPRHRIYHNVHIIRPFGHSYFGYGHYKNDYNAWRWLSFTAITLKLLDMVDEQAQREHEAAQIAATTADVGEKIVWDTDDASGYVVTTREGRSSRGLPCREYQQSITVGGKTEEAYGSACLQADGAWKIID